MLIGVTIAFRCAGAAEGDARRQLGFKRLAISRLVGPGHDTARCSAHRSTIQVLPNAGKQALDVLFRKTSIGASGAGFDAERARINAGRDRF
jgi:hypothetical protein